MTKMMSDNSLAYRHVDVFNKIPFSGNGLTVFFNPSQIASDIMQKIAFEMRQAESIFLIPTEHANTFKVKIFTTQEELDFAGHPIIGAACVLHDELKPSETNAEWVFLLNNNKTVQVISTKYPSYYEATMEQGMPTFEPPLNQEQAAPFLKALNLSTENTLENLPLQVVSTGLPNLIVPLKSGLDKARIIDKHFDELLKKINAKFVYLYDINLQEGRTWDNEGLIEDIATGSAAGLTGAYLAKYQQLSFGNFVIINQGRFVGRPSKIKVKVEGHNKQITSIQVGGEVCMVAKGILNCF